MNLPDVVDLLIVEDNQLDVEMIIRSLRKKNLADQLFVVEDGAEALDFIFAKGKFSQREMERLPKVVFLDVKLPKLNGFEVLRTIRADERTRALPVVMFTSSGQDMDIQTAYELGANSYMVKPLEFETFQEMILSIGSYWLEINKYPGG